MVCFVAHSYEQFRFSWSYRLSIFNIFYTTGADFFYVRMSQCHQKCATPYPRFNSRSVACGFFCVPRPSPVLHHVLASTQGRSPAAFFVYLDHPLAWLVFFRLVNRGSYPCLVLTREITVRPRAPSGVATSCQPTVKLHTLPLL